MGSWDVSSFGNEESLAWLSELVQSGGSDKIFRALITAANRRDYLEVNECERAIAAAELVAAAVGKPSAKLPVDAEHWLSGRELEFGAEIVDIALRVVERIVKSSELKELWDDTDSAAEWYLITEDLARRLRESAVYVAETAERKKSDNCILVNDLCEQALAHFTRGEMEEAIGKYDEAIAADAAAQLAYLGRGTCFLSTARYEKAIENFERALRINKEVLEAYHLRAQAYFHLQRYHDCIEDLNTLIRKSPDNWDAYWIRALTYETLGLYNKAVQDFTRVIERDSRHLEAYGRRAACFEYLGSHEMANKDREKMKKLSAR